MKKFLLAIILVSAFTTVSAQTESEKATDAVSESGYNRWSFELNGGVNKPSKPFTAGYYTATPSPFNVDLGVRYMFNNKIGMKADVGYYNFENKNKSLEFKSQYYRTSLQGVLNMGRILNFETFTNRFGFLLHAGGGYSQFRSDNHDFTDGLGHIIAGITGQFKLTERIVLNGDFTSLTGLFQNKTFDGNSSTTDERGFVGGVFSGTIGVTVYLGGNLQHADWFVDSNKTKDEVAELQKRIGDLETMLNDTDKDGVADYLDAEPNSTTGVAVDIKGRSIDNNGNGVPDELENYMDKTYGGKSTIVAPTNDELVKALINDGYVTTYFDYNKSTPTNVSTEGIDFILNYLRNNPSASVDIIGHADELGKTEYNDKLSTARANSVKNTLMSAKIDGSRLNIVPAGEDTSVDKNSDIARRLVRRVTFKVK